MQHQMSTVILFVTILSCAASTDTMKNTTETYIVEDDDVTDTTVATIDTDDAAREGINDNCVDISNYGPVVYNETALELCTYRMITQCVKKSKEVCVNVPKLTCKFETHVDCEDKQNIELVNDDITDFAEFLPQICQPGEPKVLTEMKHQPVCVNVTRQQCDSHWVTTAQGDQVWAGNENCRNVTWEDCSLQLKPVTTQVETFNCTPAELPVVFATVVNREIEVTRVTRQCQPVAKPWCETTNVEECGTVEWDDCDDILLPSCYKNLFRIPYQEYNHLLRCNVEH